jgi:hypothetical protein
VENAKELFDRYREELLEPAFAEAGLVANALEMI